MDGLRIVVVEDALGGALQIIILARPQRPQEGAQAQQAKAECDRDKHDQDVHGAAPADAGTACIARGGCGARRRSALPTTITEDSDMAAAATRGVA